VGFSLSAGLISRANPNIRRGVVKRMMRFRQRAAHGTMVTLLELPYEKPVYEGPVYPGTLTSHGTVPNIKISQTGVGAAIRKRVAGDIGLANSSYTMVGDFVPRSGEPQVR
jgi:hypothetical protein